MSTNDRVPVMLDLNYANPTVRVEIVTALTQPDVIKKYKVKTFTSKFTKSDDITGVFAMLPLYKAIALLTKYNGKLNSTLKIKL